MLTFVTVDCTRILSLPPGSRSSPLECSRPQINPPSTLLCSPASF